MVSLHNDSRIAGADASAAILTARLINQLPFIYVRFGDGAIECIHGKCGQTCDGEVYTNDLGRGLLRCWELLFRNPNVYLGDWQTANFGPGSKGFRYEREYELMIARAEYAGSFNPTRLHFEALLLHRESEALLNFYRAVKKDPRRKLLMGPCDWARGAKLFGAQFLPLPISHVQDVAAIRENLCKYDFDVLLYGAGMAGNIPVIEHWDRHPQNTYIHLGSALDPVYRGKTRREQLDRSDAQKFLYSIGD